MNDSGVRVWLEGKATAKDVAALKTWLERETPLAEMVGEGKLLIEERPRPDAPEGQMGLGTEIVLQLVQASTSVVVTMLLERTKRAVDAWWSNRARVEPGDQPEAQVRPLADAHAGPAQPPTSDEG